MYAIVKHSGCQKKMTVGQKLFIDRVANDKDSKLLFNEVVFLRNENEVIFGEPLVAGALVEAKVLKHIRDDKIHVRHFKRRKHHMKRQGHRQNYTQIEVTAINHGSEKPKKATKKASKTASKTVSNDQ
ncbi:MAG: 50S ribosomal protein L21 [Pseudomonadota bacterium]|nr:50S ribosomal protein L21 [Pseudomonadota bacterium]